MRQGFEDVRQRDAWGDETRRVVYANKTYQAIEDRKCRFIHAVSHTNNRA